MTSLRTCVLPILLLSTSAALFAQADPATSVKQTFPLTTAGLPKYAMEATTALHNILPPKGTFVFPEPGGSAITVQAPADQMKLARKIITDLETAPPVATQHSEGIPFQTTETTRPGFNNPSFVQTFYLGEVSADEINQTVATLRSKLPTSKVFLVPSLGALVLRVRQMEDLALARKTVAVSIPNWSADGHSSTVFAVQTTASNLPAIEQALYLRTGESPRFYNEVLTAIRNIVSPLTKTFFVYSRHTILIVDTPEELRLAEKLLKDLDTPTISHDFRRDVGHLERK
ncbi:MAG: hypothetical protein JSS87_01610 [Acidobacteria bacterium]|nr:hypothetical protein [Acidobacteriota bacterium]